MRIICWALSGIMLSGPVLAQTAANPLMNPMTFRIVRDATWGCEPACAEWIAAEGRIVSRSAEGLKAVLAQVAPRHPPIVVNSYGGDLKVAQDMGRIIRAQKLDIAVGMSLIETALPRAPFKIDGLRGLAWSAGAICGSACVSMLAGGERRFIAPTAQVAVHDFSVPTRHVDYVRHRFQEKIWKRENIVVRRERKWIGDERFTMTIRDTPQAHAKFEAVEASYLASMGMAELLAELMAETPNKSWHVMSHSELFQSRLLSDEGGAELLVSLYKPHTLAGRSLQPALAASALLWSLRETCLFQAPSSKAACEAPRKPQASPIPPFAVGVDETREMPFDSGTEPVVARFATPPLGSAETSAFPLPRVFSSAEVQAANMACRPEFPDFASLALNRYKASLAKEIAGHIPVSTKLGSALVDSYFLIGPSGKIAYLSVVSHPVSLTHEAFMRRLLGSVHFTPPPGGCYVAKQRTLFH